MGERPEIAKAAIKKDDVLLGRLRDVYTTSSDPEDFDPDINRKVPRNPDRPFPGKGVRSAPGSGFAEASQLMTSTKQKKLALDEIQSIIARFPQTVSIKSNIIQALSEKHSISAEQLLNLHTYYQVFHHEPKSEVEETEEEHDPYKPQSSWQSADESEVKQKQVSSSSTKTLPQSS